MFVRVFLILSLILAGATASAQQGYRIKAGDRLSIEVLEDPALSRQVLVLPNGSISFPLVGSLRASGQTTDALEAQLAGGLAPNFASEPTVFVSVAALAVPAAPSLTGGPTIDIYLLGEVNNRGRLEVPRGTTLLQMLAEAGGFTKFAATKRIQLRRTDPQTGTDVVYTINYQALEAGGRMTGQTILADGDVILVPQRKLFE
jgi:polysaccharide export outer membrane protein